jgi:ribonucleotide reductase alpha subunit
LVQDLIALNLWNAGMKNKLIANNGSVQKIPEIPEDLKAIYRTVWEISQKSIIDMAATRQAFIDQSQSMNIFMQNVNFGKLGAMHFYGWARGLKTGMYYLRSKPAVDAVKFTIDPSLIKEQQEQNRVENALRPRRSENKSIAPPNTNEEKMQDSVVDFSNKEELKRQREAMECSLDDPASCKACSS